MTKIHLYDEKHGVEIEANGTLPAVAEIALALLESARGTTKDATDVAGAE